MSNPADTPVHVESCSKHVRVVLGSETVADSTGTSLVWEHTWYPQYYFPREDVSAELLGPTDRVTTHPELGEAVHFTVKACGREAPDAAWRYPESSIAVVRDLIRFDWPSMDAWYEEDEEVFVHPRNSYARTDIIESSRHVRVELDGVLVADSRRPTLLFETRLPTRYYLPPDDVRLDLLTPTDRTTVCPYKGTAAYWTAEVGEATHSDIVWSYPAPIAEAAKIAGLMCFYDERVDLFVDGELQERPVTPFS